jgi:hypothetical protein
MIDKDTVKIGDKVLMLNGNLYNHPNSIATITEKGMARGEVSMNGVYQYPGHYEPVKSDKINVNDKVEVAMTYGEVAMLYAIVGKTREDTLLWKTLTDLVGDTGHKLFSKFIAIKSLKDAMSYNDYADEWVKLLFAGKSDKQIELEKKIDQYQNILVNATEEIDKAYDELVQILRK